MYLIHAETGKCLGAVGLPGSVELLEVVVARRVADYDSLRYFSPAALSILDGDTGWPIADNIAVVIAATACREWQWQAKSDDGRRASDCGLVPTSETFGY